MRSRAYFRGQLLTQFVDLMKMFHEMQHSFSFKV